MKIYTAEHYIGKGKTIGLHRNHHCIKQELHAHDYIELDFIVEGRAIETVNGEQYEVTRGDVLFIDSGSTHAFHSEQGFVHYEIFFYPTLVEKGGITAQNALTLFSLSLYNEINCGAGGGRLTLTGEDRREAEFILEAMLREHTEDRADAERVLEHYLNILLTKMRRAWEGSTVCEETDPWQSLKDYIDEHPEDNLTLSSLSGRSFYNSSYFSRVFKKKFGVSPTEYVRAARLSHAKRLLREGNSTIEEILLRAGFSDRSAFYRAFAADTGMTPSEYRAAAQADKK